VAAADPDPGDIAAAAADAAVGPGRPSEAQDGSVDVTTDDDSL